MTSGLLFTALPNDGQSGGILLLLHLQKVLPRPFLLNGLPLSTTELARGASGPGWAGSLLGSGRGSFRIIQRQVGYLSLGSPFPLLLLLNRTT